MERTTRLRAIIHDARDYATSYSADNMLLDYQYVDDSRLPRKLLGYQVLRSLTVDGFRPYELASFESGSSNTDDAYIIMDKAMLGSTDTNKEFEELGLSYKQTDTKGIAIKANLSNMLPAYQLNVQQYATAMTLVFNLARNYYPATVKVYTGVSTASTLFATVNPTSAITKISLVGVPANHGAITFKFEGGWGNSSEGFTTTNTHVCVHRIYSGEIFNLFDEIIDYEYNETTNDTGASLPIHSGSFKVSIDTDKVADFERMCVQGNRVMVYAEGIDYNPFNIISNDMYFMNLVGIAYVKSVKSTDFFQRYEVELVNGMYYHEAFKMAKGVTAATQGMDTLSNMAKTLALNVATSKMAINYRAAGAGQMIDHNNAVSFGVYTGTKVLGNCDEVIQGVDVLAFAAATTARLNADYFYVHGFNNSFYPAKVRSGSYAGFGAMQMDTIYASFERDISNTSNDVRKAIEIKSVQPPKYVEVYAYTYNGTTVTNYDTYNIYPTGTNVKGVNEVSYDCKAITTTYVGNSASNLVGMLQDYPYELTVEMFNPMGDIKVYDRIQTNVFNRLTGQTLSFLGYVSAIQYNMNNGFYASYTIRGAKL